MIKRFYNISGWTCSSCENTIQKSLTSVESVTSVQLDSEKHRVDLTMNKPYSLDEIQAFLPEKYKLIEADTEYEQDQAKRSHFWKKLIPLFAILLGITVATLLMNPGLSSRQKFMTDYMGLFFVVFSLFKFLDLKGFVTAFRNYDPLSKKLPLYGYVYPFMELTLGLLFLFHYQLKIALVLTFIVLTTTSYGIIKSLMAKEQITCACLGTKLNLPMTKVTLFENSVMILMALITFIQLY